MEQAVYAANLCALHLRCVALLLGWGGQGVECNSSCLLCEGCLFGLPFLCSGLLQGDIVSHITVPGDWKLKENCHM